MNTVWYSLVWKPYFDEARQGVTRLHTRLLLATGTYILQTNRKAFNQNKVKATCQLCHQEDETKEHFLLQCETLNKAREVPLEKVKETFSKISPATQPPLNLVQVIIDSSLPFRTKVENPHHKWLDFHARRLCYSLHVQRYRILKNKPKGWLYIIVNSSKDFMHQTLEEEAMESTLAKSRNRSRSGTRSRLIDWLCMCYIFQFSEPVYR